MPSTRRAVPPALTPAGPSRRDAQGLLLSARHLENANAEAISEQGFCTFIGAFGPAPTPS